MKKSLINIRNLSILFIKDNTITSSNIIQDKKINKKSGFFWLVIVLFLATAYLSMQIIKYLNKIGKSEIFLSTYFIILNVLLIVQAIMLILNIFYFSKDLEYVLPMPFKSIEILIAKFNTLLYFLYGTLFLFGLVPFLMYGICVNVGILYYFKLILLLIIFPVFPALVVSIIIMIVLKGLKSIKSKELIQNLVSAVLIALLVFSIYFFGFKFFNNNENITDEEISKFEQVINNIQKYFINVNSIVKILGKNNLFNKCLNFIYLILMNIVSFFIFIFIGKKTYLMQILKLNFYFKNKKHKKIKLKKRCKKRGVASAYILKEFKNILKNPIFFIQGFYPIILTTFTVAILLIVIIPVVIQANYEHNLFEGLQFDIEATMIILGGIQIIGLFNKMTVTAISREGKNAYFIKSLPIDFYEQFVYKNIPQILINSISAIIILLILFFEIKAIELKYIIIIFIMSMFMFGINSYISLILDLWMPKIKWSSEYDVFKNNKNILIQYCLIIVNIFILYYFDKFFYDYNLDKSISVILMTLGVIFGLFNFIIKKYKNKLFKKIN